MRYPALREGYSLRIRQDFSFERKTDPAQSMMRKGRKQYGSLRRITRERIDCPGYK